jgi:hypothetical protein
MRRTLLSFAILFFLFALVSPLRFAYAAAPQTDPLTATVNAIESSVGSFAASVTPPHSPPPLNISAIENAAHTALNSATTALSTAASHVASAWSTWVALANARLIAKVKVARIPPTATVIVSQTGSNAPPVTATSLSALPMPHLFPLAGASSRQSNRTYATANVGVVLGTSTEVSYVTQDELTAQIEQAANALRSLIYQNESAPNSVYATGGYTNDIALSNRIDNLSGSANGPLTISDATFNNVSGLTAAEIPDLSGTYLPLTGGTISGPLTVTGAFSGGSLNLSTASTTNFIAQNATSTTLFSTLADFTNGIVGTLTASIANITALTATNSTTTNATTTNLYAAAATIPSLAGTAATFTSATSTNFFATTASSTNLFASLADLTSATIGSLTLNTPLAVSSGGTGATTFGQGWIYSNGGTGALAASTSPTVNYITATSTTATSTFAGPISVIYPVGNNSTTTGITFSYPGESDLLTISNLGSVAQPGSAGFHIISGDSSGSITVNATRSGHGNYTWTEDTPNDMAEDIEWGQGGLQEYIAPPGTGAIDWNYISKVMWTASTSAPSYAIYIPPAIYGRSDTSFLQGWYDANDVEKTKLDTSGNFQTAGGMVVGTSTHFYQNPDTSLDVYSSTASDGKFLSSLTGNTGNILIANGATYNYGVMGVVSGTGGATGDVYGLGYSPNSDTSFTNVLNWTSTGNIGIGTTNPGSKLEVQGLASAQYFNATSSTNFSTFTGGIVSQASSTVVGNFTSTGTGTFANGAFTSTTGTSTIASGQGFTIGTSQLVVQQGNGNVGVGATPKLKLDILDTTGSDQVAVIRRGTQAGSSDSSLPTSLGSPVLDIGGLEYKTGGGYYDTIGFGGTPGNSFPFIPPAEIGTVNDTDQNAGDADLVFATRSVNTNTAPTERMRITSAGNVGIGTTTPNDLLTISRNASNDTGGLTLINQNTTGYGSTLAFRGTNAGATYNFAGIHAENNNIGSTGGMLEHVSAGLNRGIPLKL